MIMRERPGCVQLLRALLVLAVLLAAAGCGGPSKEDVLAELKPAEGERYAVHLFYRGRLPDSETKELNMYHNSHDAITNAVNEIQFWGLNQERNVKWAKALGIREFPVYLVLDADGIVLKTPFLSEVKQYVSDELLPAGAPD